MFIVMLRYIRPLEEVDQMLSPHVDFLNKYYGLKKFICSGRRNPRTGGVILCRAKSLEEVQSIIEEDPFYKEQIAEYEVVEFTPTKVAEGYEELF